MVKKTTKTGRELERQVADAYRAMGARKVEHDVELAGHQIDVYVEMETADRALHRIAVEAKEYTKPVGIQIVREFSEVVSGLRRLGEVDEGVIVSSSGFSRQARTRAKEEGLRLLDRADLAAMAGQPDLVQMRTEYLASLRQRFEYLDLGGIAPRVQNRTVKLRMDDVFIPVQACPELGSLDDWPDWMDEITPETSEQIDRMEVERSVHIAGRTRQPGEEKPVEISDLLGHPHVVILGDPGCGKTTLLRHIAYAVACGQAGSIGEATLEHLPIFVRVAQFSQAQAQDRTLTLDTYIREVCEPKWALLFQNALDNGEALILLDGLDEVIDAHQRISIAQAIQRLAADYPSNAFVVTSRIVGYQAARLSGDFVHYTIQPLPPECIAEFVEKWYAAIEREAGEAELSEEARERAAELNRTVLGRLGIRRLAENPLLLTIIALVNWRGRKLPNRRVELYAHAAQTLIESWPFRRQGVELDTERVIRLLSPVAYRVFATSPSGDIAEDDLLPILTDSICRVDGVDERTAKTYAVEFLSQISERSGIFRERGYDERGRRVFGFLHLTFAEYFAARHLAGRWEGLGEDTQARRTFLWQYAHVPRWREVVLLMAGDVEFRDNDSAERATRLLSDILSMGSHYEEYLHRDLLLAGECLADDLRVQPQAALYVLHRVLQLAVEQGRNEATQDILSAMRETAYGQYVLEGLLERLEDDDKQVRAQAAWALGILGDAQAVGRVLARLEDQHRRVRASAARALGDLGDAQAAEPLLARLEDDDELVREKAASALGCLGDTQANAVLLALLRNGDSHIRRMAIFALRYAGSAYAVEPLVARLEDEVVRIRTSAAGALGRIGDSRAVEPLLLCLQDRVERVRASAASALGRLGDARAVEPLLLCLQDRVEQVRASAASALGRLGDARAVEPLLLCLQDRVGRVRASAAWALGHLGDMEATELMLSLLEDEDAQVRASAVSALGRLGDGQTVAPLVAQLEDNDERVRASAAWALGNLEDTCATEPLLSLLDDRDERVRASAARALGILGDVQALEPLLSQLGHRSWIVQAMAYAALIAILNRNALEPDVEGMTCEPQAVSGPWDDCRDTRELT